MSFRARLVLFLVCAAVPSWSQGHVHRAPLFPWSGVKVSGPMTPGGDVAESQYGPVRAALSDDGRWAVYLADQDLDGEVGLYSFSLRDGSRRKLNRPLVFAHGYVLDFEISPDSTRVVYLDEQQDLYTVPIGGGEPVRLSGPMVPGGNVANYVITSDSQRVVYRADEQIDDDFGIFSVPIAGGTRIQLAQEGGPVEDGFHVAPDGSRVVFQASNGIWSAPVGGQTPVLLSSATQFDVHGSIDVTPDSLRVVYRVHSEGNLYSVPIAGGSTVQLNAGPFDDGNNTSRFTPDSSRVVWVQSNRMYAVSTLGGNPTPIVTPIEDLVGAPEISPDSSRVVYVDGTVFGERRLFSAPITGGAPVLLNLPPNHVAGPEISPDSRYVAFNHQAGGPLRVTPIGGGTQMTFGAVSSESSYAFSEDPLKVVFLSSSIPGVRELYAVSPSGGTPRTLNRPLVAGGDVTSFVVGGPWVLYRADQDTDEVFELYVSRMTLTDFR